MNTTTGAAVNEKLRELGITDFGIDPCPYARLYTMAAIKIINDPDAYTEWQQAGNGDYKVRLCAKLYSTEITVERLIEQSLASLTLIALLHGEKLKKVIENAKRFPIALAKPYPIDSDRILP